jgi:hypothetical protein
MPGFRHHFMLMVFSHFNGSDVFHTFARLNKSIREEIPKAGLLDQDKVLRLNKNAPKINLIKNISYGLSLANNVEFTFDNESNSDRRSD